MNIQDLKKQILAEIGKVDNEIEGQMVINWQLEGQKAAYKKVKELIADMIEQSYGEVLNQMTDTEIQRRAKMVAECYTPSYTSQGGIDSYDFNIVTDAFVSGAKWILNQLKN